jgi:dihydrofolate reductase
MFNAIFAIDSECGIAKDGVLPWPKNNDDMKHFARLTKGATVIMGKKTWDAPDMPSPLPGRRNIVICSNPQPSDKCTQMTIEGLLDNISDFKDAYVIGGAMLIDSLKDYIDEVHLTRFHGSYNCDTFVDLEFLGNFMLVHSDDRPDQSFEHYVRDM